MFNENLRHNNKYKDILKNYGIDEEYILEKQWIRLYGSSAREYIDRKELLKKCAKLCCDTSECKDSFKPIRDKITGEIKYKTSFYIIESSWTNKNNEKENLYSFMVNSPKKVAIHVGTFKEMKNKLGLLRKTLSGLKQAGRQWMVFTKSLGFLKKIGLIQYNTDSCFIW